jgi:hypothetical protein
MAKREESEDRAINRSTQGWIEPYGVRGSLSDVPFRVSKGGPRAVIQSAYLLRVNRVDSVGVSIIV